jgi:hypothetical protein
MPGIQQLLLIESRADPSGSGNARLPRRHRLFCWRNKLAWRREISTSAPFLKVTFKPPLKQSADGFDSILLPFPSQELTITLLQNSSLLLNQAPAFDPRTLAPRIAKIVKP